MAQQEQLDLFTLYVQGKASDEQSLKDHQERYFWIENDWATGIQLDIDYFKKRLKQYNTLGVEIIQDRINTTVNEKENLQKRKDKFRQTHQIPEVLQNILYFFSRTPSRK